MQITTSVALRRLEWPELPRADLATEFHWLIHDATDTTRDQQDHRHDDKTDAHDEDDDAQDEEFAFSSPLASSELDRSPYRQLLHQPKERRPPLSPAQRAAKKILKLKLELGCLDEEHGLREYSKQQLLLGDSVDRDSDYRREFHDHQRKKTKKPASESVVSRTKPVLCSSNCPTAKANCREPQIGQSPPASTNREPPASRSAVSSASLSTPPSRSAATAGKKKARPEPKEQRELRELHTKQQRLAAWLSGDNAKETRLGKKSGDDDASKHVTYSIEVESRIHDAMESNRGKGLWGDSVASLIAREMTSESVFGGFIPTRRLAFPTAAAPGSPPPKRLTQPSEALKLISKDLQPGSGSPDNLLSEYLENSKDLAGDDEDYRVQIPVHEDASSSLIHERALEIREEAQSLVLAGNIEDALATLQSGIKQLLFDFQDNQDEIQAKGFDFSQDAHNKATRVQLHYKARHRSRVQHIAFLQRVWRNHQVRRAFLDTKAYRHLNAKVIQRQYKTRYFQLCRTRAATRIQTCFRVFQEQKMWIYMHRACRLLVSDERKKREKIRRRQVLRKRLWVKLSSVLKLLWLWKSRFRALTQVQSHWKGSLARVEYAKLLAVKCEAEQERLARELEFVQPRLDRAMALCSKFLRKTSVGGELVRWQMNKPWLRFKRLRLQKWDGLELRTKVQTLCDVLVLNHKGQLSALLLRVVGHLLGIDASKVATIRQPMRDTSAGNMVALYEDLLMTLSASGPVENSVSDVTPVLSSRSKRSRVTKWLRRRQKQWTQWWQSLVLWMGCSVLLFYWYAVLWPIGYMLTRRSTANKQRALSILEQQQRFALTKHLRHTFRQLDSNAGSSKNHPNFACQHCFEAFATARAWNLHLRECKRDYEAQLVEWDAVRSDIAFLSQQYVREPTPRLLLPATTPLEFYLGFSTFEPESEFVQLLRFEKRWSSRKRALKVLVNMAICCGVNTSAVENVETTSLELQEHGQQQQVALALVAYLLLPLRPHSDLHPLVIPQLHAFVVWTQPSVSSTTQSQWIFEKELFATLLLSKSRRRSCLKLGRVVDIAAHAVSCCWQRAKTWALSSSILLMNQGASASSATVLPEA